jgi:hypothetical protein
MPGKKFGSENSKTVQLGNPEPEDGGCSAAIFLEALREMLSSDAKPSDSQIFSNYRMFVGTA